MEALEFSTQIEHGIIKLPKELEQYSNTFVRIIMLAEKPTLAYNKKEQLKAVMQQMGEHNIFSGIENPSEWQKKIRDEWE